MLIFIQGTEGFLIKRRIDVLKKDFQLKYPNANLDIFDLEDNIEFKTIRESFSQGGGLFSPKKLVVLKGVLSLAAAQQEPYSQLLKESAQGDDLIAIIVAAEGKEKKTKLYKFLEKEGKKEACQKLEGAILREWIEQEVKKRSGNNLAIHSSASELLAMITKGDLWKINNELEKLINFKEEGLIAVEDINQLSQGEAETKIFDLVDAISQKNKARANELIFHLLNAGENEFYIFTMIVFQFRNLVRVADCQKKGIFSPQAISKSIGIHPYVATKSVGQLRNFSATHLKAIYNLAAQLDYEVKIGDRDMQQALTYFVSKI